MLGRYGNRTVSAQRMARPPFGPLSSKNTAWVRTGLTVIRSTAPVMSFPTRARRAASRSIPLIRTAPTASVIMGSLWSTACLRRPSLQRRSNPGAKELGQLFRGVVVGEPSRGGAGVGSGRPNEV